MKRGKDKNAPFYRVGMAVMLAAVFVICLTAFFGKPEQKTTVYPGDGLNTPVAGERFDPIAEQTGVNSVKLSWTAKAGAAKYHYSYRFARNAYYHFGETAAPEVEIRDLIPGGLYEFRVSGTREGLDEPSSAVTTLLLTEAGTYRSRGYILSGCGMCYVTSGESPADESLAQAFTRTTESELRDCASIRDAYLTLAINFDVAGSASVVRCLAVTQAPDGQRYVAACDWSVGKKAYRDYRYCVGIDSMLSEMGAFKAGEYRVTLYLNGQYAAETVFSVTKEAAG